MRWGSLREDYSGGTAVATVNKGKHDLRHSITASCLLVMCLLFRNCGGKDEFCWRSRAHHGGEGKHDKQQVVGILMYRAEAVCIR